MPTKVALTFSFKDVIATLGAEGGTDADLEGPAALNSKDKIASRDSYYRGVDFGNIVIAKDKISGARTVSIDPVNVPLPGGEDDDATKSWIMLGSEDKFDEEKLTIIAGVIELTAEGLPAVDTVERGLFRDLRGWW